MRFGDYELLSQIATGGMSEVFLARPIGGDEEERVVVKRILPVLAEDSRFVELFAEEARISSLMDHPNVVRILNAGVVGSQPYIVMEHVDGLDCWRMVHRCSSRGSQPPPRASIFAICEILLALDHVHNAANEKGEPIRVVHGDVSPTNIYISRTGQVKLGDFGIARAKHRDMSDVKSNPRGKVAYLAPEQVMGTVADNRADLFSAGTVLTELLIQTRLFGGGSQLTTLLAIRDVRLDVMESNRDKLPEGLEPIIRRALARDREERFPTALTMYRALERFLDDAPADELRAELSEFVELALEERSSLGTPPPSFSVSKPVLPVPALSPDQFDDDEEDDEDGLYEDGLYEEDDELASDTAINKAIKPQTENDGGLPEVDFGGGELDLPPVAPAASEEQQPEVDEPEPEIERFVDDEQAVQEELIIDIDIDDMGDEVDELEQEQQVQYTFRRADGSILGPMTYIEAVERVIADQIRSSYEVSKSGGPFRPLAEERDLARHAPSLTPITTEFATVGPPDRRGLITEDEPVWAVLFEFARARETGLAIFDHKVVRKEVYITDGNLHYVSSNVSSELLGKSLVERQLIDEEQLSRALAALPRFNNHLGDALVGLQMLEPVTLFRYIQDQVKDKFLDIFSWRTGEYMLYRGVENENAAFPLRIVLFSVLWTGVQQGISGVEANEWLDQHREWTVAPAENPAITLDDLILPEAITSILTLITRPMSVGLVTNMTGSSAERLDLARSLQLTTDIGIFSFDPPRASTPPTVDHAR